MKKLSMVAAMTAFATLLLGACSPRDDAGGDDAAGGGAAEGPNPTRNAYFGDLHVHTRYSFDAFIFGTTTDPNDAYEFAKGGTIKHPAGFDMQLDRPLDFQAVADHGMYLGMLPAMTEEDSPVYGHPIAADLRVAEEADERRGIFVGMGPYLRGDPGTEEHLNMDVVRGAWSKIVEAAEVHNDPGNFTAFIGYEFTSSGYERDNLHRNVIFRGSEHPDAPFSRLDSQNPEDLWAAMDGWRDQGIEALAIPHNSNGSGGRMFEMEKFYGDPFDDEYSDVRMRNEPIVEMTQVKGTSDTHPALSPNDEWADFEIMPYKIATTIISDPPGSYVRDALIRGLRLADGGLANPYKFGLIGASDTHVSAGSFEEDNYWSKVGILDAEPQLRGSVPGTGANQTLGDETQQSDASMRTGDGSGRTFRDTYYYTWGASGLAGVWAEENTREAIFDAMRRKETFATSGPRMKIRFFAGDFEDGDLDDAEFLTKAYAEGVPMGGDLLAADDGLGADVRGHGDARFDGGAAAAAAGDQGIVAGRRRRRGRLRRRLLRRRRGRPDHQPLPRQRRNGRSRDVRHQRRRRRRRTEGGLDRPRLRGLRSRLLLRPRTREPHLPLVDLGRHARRRRAAPGHLADHPGTRLVLPYLVQRGLTACVADTGYAGSLPR